jgi:PAS domain S-box-containing protein
MGASNRKRRPGARRAGKSRAGEPPVARCTDLDETVLEKVAALVVVFDPEGRIVRFNAACERLTGYSCEEVKGTRPWDFLLTAEDASAVEAAFMRLDASQFPNEREQHWVAKDGSRHLVSWTHDAVLGDDHAVEYVVCTGIEMTERRTSDDALREREAHLRAVFEHAFQFLGLLSPDGALLEVNRSALEFAGTSREHVIGRPFWETPWWAGNPVLQQRLANAIRDAAQGHFARFETTHTDAGGRTATIDFSLTPVMDGSGRVVLLVPEGRDITQRKLAEDAMRRSEAILAQAGEMAHLGAWWIEISNHDDLRANPLRWSDEVYRIFGYAPQAVEVTSQLFFDRVHPDDRSSVADAVAKALAEKQPYQIEHRIIRPNGTERIVLEHAEITFDDLGRPSRIVGAVQDITERKQAEEALRTSESKYRSLYRSTPVMMHSIDRDGRLLSVSDSWLETLGYDRAEVLGRKAVEFLTPESRKDAVEVVLPEYFRTGVCRDVPYRFVKKNGDVIDVVLSAIAEKDVGGRFVRSLSVLIDVTQRKRAEEALREADRRKSEFLGVLSHELRNPLAPIQNALYILDRAEPGGEQAARAKAIIARQVAHLARLVDDLLDVTRISRGKIRLRRSRFDLGELVLRTVEDHRALFADREIALDVRISPGPLPVDADETRVAQVLGNLLLNSAKFTDGGGRVAVSVEPDGDAAEISVRDTGAGISPEMLGRLFEPFTQADDSLHRSRGGLGLGLSLVKGLVELHGGAVVARSEGVGQGAELVVRLRLAAAREEAPRPPAIGPARVPRRRVLVIEDNPDTAETLREMLEMDGHDAEITHRGRDGIEKARAFRPEIILCDIGLPDMDGYTVARGIRSDPTLAFTLLVALTGYALPEDRLQAEAAGFDRHLTKPVSVAQIEEVLSTVVQAGSARSEQRSRLSGVE